MHFLLLSHCFLLKSGSVAFTNKSYNTRSYRRRMLCGDISFTFFISLLAMLSTKSTKFGSRYLVDRLSAGDEIWQTDCCELWPQGTPWGTKIMTGVKIFCNAFLIHCVAEHDKIWHNEGHWCVADLLVNFGPLFKEHKFLTADIAHICCWRMAKFGSIRGLASWHLFLNSVNFSPS